MAERDLLEQRLREHLAAPPALPDGATERVVAAVRARIADPPPRRSPLPLLAGAASGLVLAAVLATALTVRWAHHGGDRPTTTAPAVSAPRPPAATPAPGFHPADAAFGDDVHGWELGDQCDAARHCVLAVRATADGGRTWSAPSTVDPDSAGASGVSQVAFSGRTGFVAAGPLYASDDGGATWREVRLTADTIAVAPVGASVWVLDGCPGGAVCPLQILTSADGGHTWSDLLSEPPLVGPDATMVRVSAADAFVAGSAAAAGGGSRLAATHDGGRTWEALADPCAPGMLGAAPALAALEPTELWAACESPVAGTGRAVYRSRDGGHHWELRASSTAGPGLGAAGRLHALALAPRGAVYLALDGGPLLRSGDGTSWRESLPASAGGVRRIDLLDTNHGWVVTATGRVLRTSDGGRTWTDTAP